VIVPIYNVAKYLRDCLESLVHQSYQNIEVIMVNDGSTDPCGAIMHHYAERFPNFYGFDKPNGGLGQARNFGLNVATGDYFAFVDSDDRVAADAYEKMVGMAEQTGSDIVVGNVLRFNAYKTFPSGIHQKAILRTKRMIHITTNPELIYDTTAWNKLYRASFWKKNKFAFPEGMLYEDIPVTFPAHYLARSVDVLDETVYYWRFRNFGDHSITQHRTSINNLSDRLKAIEMVNRFFEAHLIDQKLCDAKDYKLLNVDFMMYLNKLPDADEAYYHLFQDYVIHYLQEVPERIVMQLRPVDRLKYYFLRQDKAKLFQLIRYQKSTAFRRTRLIRREDGHYYTQDPFHEQVPGRLLMIDEALEIKQQAERVFWRGDHLVIKGSAYIEKLDVRNKGQVSLRFLLEDAANGGEQRMIDKTRLKRSLTNSLRAAISGRLRSPHFDWVYHYDWSAYELIIPFTESAFAALPAGTYTIIGELSTHGLTRRFTVGFHPGSRVTHRMILKHGCIIVKAGGSGTLYLIVTEKE
jgi:Glycosyltransferases involved in cell wall biogenesis